MARYANDTLCHVWASGKKYEAQSNHGSLFFEGRALYSYGRHYCIAVRMNDGIVLFNADRASITTSKHTSYAWRAALHMTRHDVPDLTDIATALAADSREDWQSAAIARHARKHALAMPQETVAYLMQCAGLSPSKAAKAASAARKAAEREAADKAAKQARETLERHLETARTIAALTAADRAARIAALAGEWNPVRALQHAGTTARRAHKAAKARGWNAMAANVWQYIRALDGKRHWLVANEEKHKAREYLRDKVRQARGYAGKQWDSIETWELRRITDSFGYIARNGKGLSQAQRDSLLSVANQSDSIRKEREAIEAARRFEREREAREAWLNGASGYWRGNDGNGGALIRATGVEQDESGTITGGTLETSQGASVPLIHAIRIFQIARACREAGRTMEPRARVGFYTVDKVDSSGGFNAGCHRINWPEIERLAASLGLYP